METGPRKIEIDGKEFTVAAAFMGAEGRYEDYIFLQMLQFEWERPITAFEGFSHFPEDERPSARAAFTFLFSAAASCRSDRRVGR
jgi:hypothetical protein